MEKMKFEKPSQPRGACEHWVPTFSSAARGLKSSAAGLAHKSKSIKWRLQLWYGLILVVVLTGLGLAAWHMERDRVMRHIDAELGRRFSLLADAVRPPPHRPRPREFAPPPDAPPEFAPPHQEYDPDATLRRIDSMRNLFQNGFNFVINPPMEAGQTRTDFAEDVHKAGWHGNFSYDKLGHLPQEPETVGDFRGIVRRLPSGETIQVSYNMAAELKDLRLAAWKLAGFGGVILFFGLAGGWWIASHSLRPIVEISSTATKISAGDLSQRINTAETESELGQLAAVLNSTFARLEAAFAQQKQFASDAAHELRTPVSVILTQTQTALNRERSADDYRQTVEACQRAAQRMRRLIESLLELARFDAGQEVLKRLPFDFSKVISENVELVQPLAGERGVKIISELVPLQINGDAERLSQVVMNLLTNAIQFSRTGGEVHLKLEAQNGLAILNIADTGQGIAPEDLPRVFERFYRADKSRTGGSSGLGLSICKAIVEAHGGTIEVASAENQGTTFTVRLPMN
jgi:heavy metal sensor kinase